MSRLRPCHTLSKAEAEMQAAMLRPLGGDICSGDGAERLRDRLIDYWTERGYDVEVKCVEAGFHHAMRAIRVDIRSDMVNGMPVRRAGAA